jgi:hypothetical protein
MKPFRIPTLSVLLVVAACGTDLDLGPGNQRAPAGGPSAPNIGESAAAPAPKTFAEEARELGKGWAWLDPQPTGEFMYAAAGTSMSDLWYAGTAGTILHWDGLSWKVREVGEQVALDMAWSPRAETVWAAGIDPSGMGRMYRIDATSIVEDASVKGFAVQAISGLNDSQAWAVGPRGEVRAWDGNAWTTIRSATGNWLRGLQPFSSSDVWAVGDRGEIVHYDGATWKAAAWDGVGDNPLDADLRYEGIWGAAPNDVWAVAMHATKVTVAGVATQSLPVFAHYDGAKWSVAFKPTDACNNPPGLGAGTW